MGGSVFWHHRDFLLPRVISQVRGKLPSLTDGVEIVPAGLGTSVGDYAALALVFG
jgi:glucokinase